jgi:arylsulfatase A-like enzyme
MALNVDLAPTLLDLAGLALPKATQGRSLVPLLKGEKPPEWRTDFFHEHLFDHPQIPKYEGVRTERHTYLRYFEQQPVYEELYDHVADPDEERNLVGDPAHAALLDRLRTRCNELRGPLGGPFQPWPHQGAERAKGKKVSPGS